MTDFLSLFGGKHTTTPGPRVEFTVSRIDRVHIFDPDSYSNSSLLFPAEDLPVSLKASYPELWAKAVMFPAGNYMTSYAHSSRMVPVFFAGYPGHHGYAHQSEPVMRSALAHKFDLASYQNLSWDWLLNGSPATIIARATRERAEIGNTKQSDVYLTLLGIKVDPASMSLPSYADYLVQEELEFNQFIDQGGDM